MKKNSHSGSKVRALRWLVLLLAVSAGLVSPGQGLAGSDTSVIFMYHRFGDARYPSTNIRMEQFRAQVDYLESNGFSVTALDDVVAALKGGQELPEKTVVLTMDDAYASVYENAWPVLKEKGWPFTVFVATDAVDRRSREYMTWEQMRELAGFGVQFANHSASHPHMIDRAPGETEEEWLNRLKADVEKAQRRLREELGQAPMLFAYPYGEYDAKVGQLVSGMGYVAFGQHSGAAGRTSDLKAVPRFPLSEAYGELPSFKAKANSRSLPVEKMTPWDPVTTDRRPELDIVLAPTDALLDELSCYVSGQGRVAVEWVVPGKRFTVRAEKDLPPGRHKYNITVPDKNRRHYHWFSRQWIVRE